MASGNRAMNRPSLAFPEISREHRTEIRTCCRLCWTLPSFAGFLLGTLNDLPGLPARKRCGSEVLRGMRFGPGACLRELRQPIFTDGQVLLALRSRHGSE